MSKKNVFIYGDDLLMIDNASAMLSRLYNRVSLSEMETSLTTLSLLSSHGVMIVTSEWGSLDQRWLESSGIHWAILFKGLPDKRTKLFKWLNQNTRTKAHLLPKPYDVEAITARVNEIIESHNLVVPHRLVKKLVTTYGNDLVKIQSELTKAGYTGIVSALDTMQPSVLIWDLGTALMQGNKLKSMFAVRQLTLEPDVKVLSILAKQFHEILQVKAKVISLPSWKRAKLGNVIQKVSLEHVTNLSDQCYAALNQIKTGQPFDLEVWVMTMM